MDDFELKPEPKTRKRSSLIWIFLTILTLLASCGLVYYFFWIFTHPNSPLNPFPPAAIPTRYQTVTPTKTIIPLPPTWTPTPTLRPSSTRTTAPTWTPYGTFPTASQTPEMTPGEGTPAITSTPMPAEAEISYVSSATVHAGTGCDWMGIGGTVVDADGNPLPFKTVHLSGALDGDPVEFIMLNRNIPGYGEAGFEFVLADHPIASTQELWIQLIDNDGTVLTQQIYFDTFDDCEKNLVSIVFTKTR